MYVNCLEARRYAPLLTNGSGPHAPALMNIQTIADTEILKVPMDLVWRLREENLQVASVYDTWLLRYLQEHQEHKQVLCLPTEDRLRWLAEKRPDHGADCFTERYSTVFEYDTRTSQYGKKTAS